MVLIQFHFLEEFKCLKTKVVWYENPGLPASRCARTPSDAARVLNSLQNPGACLTFHNHSTTSTKNSYFTLNWVSKDAYEWLGWAESDDGMLHSLDLHDSRSVMITFLGRSKRDGSSRAQPMMPLCHRGPKTLKNIFSKSRGVSQLCPSLVALTRFLLGKGWPRTSKSELMGSCWFTVKILLSLIHDISDNRGYHSRIFAILSIFSLLAEEGIKERENLHVQ